MRRSVREATIGFSLLAALVGGFALWFWLTGVAFGQKVWTFRLRFDDAAGLAPQSTVTFRGVAVGTVRQVKPESGAVLVTVQINDQSLLLPRPLLAQVRSGSLLGGDPQIALVTEAATPPRGLPGPLAKNCDANRIVCADGLVQGIPTPSLTTVMGLMESILAKTEKEDVIGKVASTTTEISKTSKAFGQTARRADLMLASSDQLVKQLQTAVRQAQPVITNLKAATAEANATMKHANNIAAAFDNPKVINELKRTISNAEQLTRRVDSIGGDVQKLSSDPSFVDGLRSVTLGLGKFFDELYPSIKQPGKAN
jgi:phospholipid/cholesterol/gamma-HCH transport system substrate-binding protein